MLVVKFRKDEFHAGNLQHPAQTYSRNTSYNHTPNLNPPASLRREAKGCSKLKTSRKFCLMLPVCMSFLLQGEGPIILRCSQQKFGCFLQGSAPWNSCSTETGTATKPTSELRSELLHSHRNTAALV